MDDFGYPDPVRSEDGIETNNYNSDYASFGTFGAQPNEIRIYNDAKADGDTLLFVTLRPNAVGKFESGFAQDLYVFQENVDFKTGEAVPEFPGGSKSFIYSAPITTDPNSSLRSAVVLIQDNEKEKAGSLRRTTLDGGNNVVSFLSDNLDDTILAGAGNDTIRGGGGNDIIFGQAGDDRLYGDNGNDYLFGGAGRDRLYGGDGNDWLDGGLGDDILEGGNGNDTYVVDSPGDKIIDQPGTGIETVKASVTWNLQAGLDHLILTGGALNGGGNNLDNFILGNNLGNTLNGGDGNDILFGDELGYIFIEPKAIPLTSEAAVRPYVDTLENIQAQRLAERGSLGGDDHLFGGNGNDKLFGGGGNDKLFGGNGNDWLFGGDGNDMLVGESGDDRLDGGLGNDRLEGGAGNDILIVSDGNDLLIGGAGADKFQFNKRTSGKTTIQDFKPGEDVIEISQGAFGSSLSQYRMNGNDLLFNDTNGTTVLATIQSSSPFNINQNIRLI